MGSASSKATTGNGEHVFTSDSSVRFSQQVVDGLQSSTDTDGTRASDLELHIQNRVKQELKRLETEQNKALSEIHKKLQEDDSKKDPTQPTEKPDLGRHTVQKEIEELRKRLSQRKLKEEIVGDKALEKAKEEMVGCLRVNDRRPLDCWKEVDAFKTEVARLEKQFIGKVLE